MIKIDLQDVYRLLVAALVLIIVISNVGTVINDVGFTYSQFIGNEVLDRLSWASANLVRPEQSTIFVISGKEDLIAPYIDYWRSVIGAFVPDAFVYVGRVDGLLQLKSPWFDNSRLQAFALRYWSDLKDKVATTDGLRKATIVVIEGLYQPITKWELQCTLVKKNDGVYVVGN